jgi:hypothetical protein
MSSISVIGWAKKKQGVLLLADQFLGNMAYFVFVKKSINISVVDHPRGLVVRVSDC